MEEANTRHCHDASRRHGGAFFKFGNDPLKIVMDHTLPESSWVLHRQRNTLPAGLILAFLVSLSCSTVSRSAQQAPDQLYEALKVSRVALIAQPLINVEEFRPLVAQKADTPYSTAQVRRSVAALQGTGQFTKVEVEVSPEAEGLRVTFIMEPAFYVGMISFPGATKDFSYQRLLQVVNYPPQEPYEVDRARQGEKSLTRFFSRQGYFVAQVKMESRLDPARQVADLMYNVTLGRRAKFGSVEVIGPPPDEIAQIKGALRSLRARLHGANLKQGMRYDPDRLQAANRFLHDFLGKQNHLASNIRVDTRSYNPQTNKAPVRLRVNLGPTVLVRVEGARLSQRSLRSLIPMYEENSFDQDLVQEGKRNLVSYFQGKGFFEAKIDPQTTQDPSQISLVYQVDLGSRYRVASVKIAGNRRFDQAVLADQVVVQRARLLSHGKFSNDLMDRSVNNLTAFYGAAGYPDAKVQPEVIKHDRNLDVTFRISQGELTRVQNLEIQGNKTQTIANLAPNGLNLKAGQPYSQLRLDKDRSQIIASYLRLGYPNATLRWSVNPSGAPHGVVVAYQIDEGPEVHVSSVAILGASHTKLGFLEKNAGMKAGAPLDEGELLGTESSLYNLGIFDWVNVAPRRPITDQSNEEVQVKVHEAKRNSVTYGFGLQYTPVSGSLSSGIVALPGLPPISLPDQFKVIEKNVFSPLGSVEYRRLNLFGRAETVSIGTFLSVLDQRASFSFADPQFAGLTWSSLLNASAEHSAQNPLFTARLGSATFQMERAMACVTTADRNGV